MTWFKAAWRTICRMAVVVVVTASTIVGRPASAQGTSGTLPDPVSGSDLNKFLDRYLDLTPEQWTTVEAAHEAYKEEFKRLRETEIEQFMKEMNKLQGRMPKKGELKEFLEKMDRMQAKIRGLDSKLFSDIEMGLTPDQRVQMPRVRKARERDTYSGDMTRAFGGPPFDLSETFYSLPMSKEERASADPIVYSYENQLTALSKRHYDATVNSFVVMFEAIEKSGLDTSWIEEFQDPEVMQDPEKLKELQAKAMEFQKVMMAAMAEASKKSNEISADITKLHHMSRAAVTPHLKPETARHFKEEFYRKAYPRLMHADAGASRQFEAALKLHDLSSDERDTIKASFESFERSDDAMVESIVKAIDEFRAARNPMDYGEDYQKNEEKVTELTTKRQAAATSAIESLHAMLGPERSEKLQRVGTKEGISDVITGIGEVAGDAVASEVAAAIGEDEAPAEAGVAEQAEDWSSPGGDMYLPGMMGAKEVAMISQSLDLDGDKRAVLDALHTEYINEFNTLNTTVVKAVQDAQQAQWKQMSEQGPAGSNTPSENEIEQIYVLRKKAREAILALDEKFMTSVGDIIAAEGQEDQMRLLRLYRGSAYYPSQGYGGWGPFSQSQESQVNTLQMLSSIQLDDASRSIVEHLLLEKADDLVSSMKQLYEVTMTNQIEQEKYSMRMQAKRQEDPEAAQSMGFEWMEMARKHAERAEAPMKKRLELNRSLLDTLAAALPSDQARKIKQAYNRLAFPGIFNDGKSAEHFLETASRLSDLNDEQRQQLTQATTEFHETYDKINDQMVRVTSEQMKPFVPGNDPEAWKEYQRVEQILAKHRFDRDEASAKAIRRIRSILQTDQADRVPGLATAEQDTEPEIYYP